MTARNAAKRKPMDVWIREAMLDEEPGEKLKQLRLIHMVGMQQRELRTTVFGTKAFTPENLAKMFRGLAETHVQELAGVHTFELQAFYGDRTEPEAYYPFLVNSEGDHSGLYTESPTEQGKVQQNMRHAEMVIQQAYRRQERLDELTIRFAEMQANYVVRLTDDNREMFAVMKDMMMNASLNSHQHQMQQLQYSRETEERAKFLSYAPALINTILGREIFPQNNADTALIDAAAEALGEDDIMKLAGIMPPELMGPLASRIEQAMAKKRRKQEEMDRIRLAAANHPDPAADAAGEMPQVVRLRGGAAK